jgi:thymidylate kinase
MSEINYKFITIEGNIGSGKSTLLKKLKHEFENKGYMVFLIDEPLERWEKCKDVNGQSKFESFYKNRSGEAFSFQLYVQMTRIALINKVIESVISYCRECDSPKPVVVLSERSLQSGNLVFGNQLVSHGFLSQMENDDISRLCNELLIKVEPKNRASGYLVIALDTPPHVCLSRGNDRARKNESVSMELLQDLDLYQMKMIVSWYNNKLQYCLPSINCGTEIVRFLSGNDNVDTIAQNVFNCFDNMETCNVSELKEKLKGDIVKSFARQVDSINQKVIWFCK